MFSKTFAATLFVGATFLTPMTASAQMLCGERTGLIDRLIQKYGESRQGLGMRGEAAVFEVWASEKTGSWTILFTRPNGVACVMATGHDWQSMPTISPVGDPA